MLKVAPVSTIKARATNRAKPVVRWGITHGLLRTVFRGASKRGDVQGLLIEVASDRERGAELRALYDQIRAEGGVVRGGLSLVVVDHRLVREVLSSNDFRTGIPTMQQPMLARLGRWSASDVFNPIEPPSLLVTEPPDHTRYRKLVTRVFTARAVEQLRARTQQVADELLGMLDPGEPVDLITSYCGLLPVTVISEILGVPIEQRETILSYGEGAAASLDVGLAWSTYRGVERTLHDFDEWLTDHLTWLRGHPGDNLLSHLIEAQEDGVGLTEKELKATAGLVLAAGFETTVNLLSNGIALLASHPDQLASLREDPSLWANAVDEILRLDPPVLLTGRMSLTATTVGEVEVPAGMPVTTVLAAANRDPSVFADPDRFDVTRANARDHVSFSSGRHYCLGAQLAKMEGEVGLRSIFDRFPGLRLDPGSLRRSTRILRGYEKLPARLTP